MDIKELRGLYDTVETQVRSLHSLGLDEKNYGSLLIPVIMSKLPQEIKLIITRQFGKHAWDVKLVLNALKNELEAREKSNLSDSFENNSENFTSTFLANNNIKRSSENNQNYNSCVFCKKANHKSHNCRTINKIEARKKFIKKRKTMYDVFCV